MNWKNEKANLAQYGIFWSVSLEHFHFAQPLELEGKTIHEDNQGRGYPGWL